MRAYDVAISSLALDVERKWLDNLLAQHDVPGVERVARGVSRQLSMRALVAAAVVRDLQRELGVPVARGLEVARHAADSHGHDMPLSPALSVRFDLSLIEREIGHRLIHAMERAAPRRRGRPPHDARKRRRGTP